MWFGFASDLHRVLHEHVYRFVLEQTHEILVRLKGLAGWPSHILQLSQGRVVRFDPFEGKEGSIFKQMVAWLSATCEDSTAPLRAPACPRHVTSGPTVSIQGLCFRYGAGSDVRLEDFSLRSCSRCVLVGLNGTGKSTLLALLAGRRMGLDHGESVKILGLRPFQDHAKLDRDVTILSSEWKRQVGQLAASSGLTFRELAESEVKDLTSQGFNAALLSARLLRLMQMLHIDPTKPFGLLSDGALRRAQLGLKLLKPVSVLLIDEVTADLDVLARDALLQFLKEDSEEGSTIIYCTHIMDGLEGWATHYLHLRPLGLPGLGMTSEGLVGNSGARSDAALSQQILHLLRADEGAQARAREEPKSASPDQAALEKASRALGILISRPSPRGLRETGPASGRPRPGRQPHSNTLDVVSSSRASVSWRTVGEGLPSFAQLWSWGRSHVVIFLCSMSQRVPYVRLSH
ncbi:ABCI20 [Symbiodinium natans]|uniref:ABCI20 protein n=1 Tax=Symbiodinium natans TaxID=878477 RepID=A0A812N4X0_9DINO|nr:ABCI20 [Symbiodinium natans]